MDAVIATTQLPSREAPGASSAARTLELVVCTLVLLGLVMSYSASAPFVAREGDLGDTFRPFLIHSVKLLLGLLLFVGARRVPVDWLLRHHKGLLLGVLVLLVLVLVPGLGARLNGARRWFSFGALTFQPVELAKIVVVIAVSARLHQLREGVARLTPCVVLILTMVAPVCLLLCLQPDFGSTVLLAGLVFLLMIFGGARPAHYVPATLLGFGTLVTCAWFFMPHVIERFSKHVAPQPGDQAYQSLVALGSGGMAGLHYGVGDGMAKLGYLPMIRSDFVFASIGEEFGFLGTTLVVFLYALFTVMAARIVLAQRDRFRFLLAAGISLGISIQVLINLVVVTAVTPTKGIALPFLSAGGSSLVMSLLAVGLLTNLARNSDCISEDIAHGPVEPQSVSEEARG